MKPLDGWRRELRTLIPRGFLRRDQSPEYLFVSDFPRFEGAEDTAGRLRNAGFTVRIAGGLAHLDAGREKYAALLRALPCPCVTTTDDNLFACSLARRLCEADTPIERQPLRRIGQWMKRLDAENRQVIPEIAAYAARCQREGRPLPSAAGKVIFCALAHAEGGND